MNSLTQKLTLASSDIKSLEEKLNLLTQNYEMINLNESEEFLTKKYDRICRALNNQNLLNDSTELPF